MNKREKGLDLLRLIAALLVVSVHVCTAQRKLVLTEEDIKLDFHFFCFTRHLAASAVAVFIMLSGAFILKSKSTLNYRAFYKKSWGKIVVPTIFFSIFYLFFEWFVYYKTGVYSSFLEGSVALKSFLLQVLKTLQGLPAEHMWYMYALIGLYILAPFVAGAKEMMGEKDFVTASIVMCLWGVIDALVQPPVLNWGIGYVAKLLGIFMMGYVAHEWALKKSGNGLALRLILAGLSVNTLEYLIHLLVMHNENVKRMLALEVPYNFFIVISCIFYIAGFTVLDLDIDLAYPSVLTYWVYLVHPAVMMVLLALESAVFHVPYHEVGTTNKIAWGFANTLIVYLLSFAVGHVIEKYIYSKKNRAKAQIGTSE